jgi:hypothetical protein
MHPSNDPFYCGSPGEVRDAQWFAKIWRTSGMKNEHLRALHYWLVSDKQPEPYKLPRPVTWTDKETGLERTTEKYINNAPCWFYLEKASIKARDLGLVDPDEISDNRSPDPTINATLYDNSADYSLNRYDLDGLSLPLLPDSVEVAPTIQASVDVYQPYLVEIWIEKSTLDRILKPICRNYGVNIVGGKGFSSATAIRSFLKRVREVERPARILYISDYDKNGRGMPFAVARRIEFYQHTDGFDDLDIALEPIVLTAEQVEFYDLPRSPEDGESVELDAMKVNYPGELEQIIRSAILRYYDTELGDKEWQATSNLHRALGQLRNGEINDHKDEIERLTHEYISIATEINEVINKHRENFEMVTQRLRELSDLLQDDIEDEISESVNPDYYIPSPETMGDLDDMLYSSDRDYWRQLEVYKARKNGIGNHG